MKARNDSAVSGVCVNERGHDTYAVMAFTYVADVCEARHSPRTSATVCNASAVKDLTVVVVRLAL